MRGFIVLCLAAVAVAAPQGYNYNPAGSQQGTGFAGSSFGGSGGFGSVSGGGSTGGYFQGGQQQQSFGGHSSGVQQHQQQQHQQAVVSKRFYIHTAPEDHDEQLQERHITVGTPKKNYNVVFIKHPQSTNRKASIKISPAVNEDKTVIYVLSKKTDSSDIHAEVLEQAAPTSKPEVFFIKYKTNEEAQHAQQQIQAQYDSLGGSSQVTDEGVAPVSSVIGSLGGGADAGAGAGAGVGGVGGGAIGGGAIGGGAIGGGQGSHGGATSNAYLPPNF